MRRLWRWVTSFPMTYRGYAFRDRVTGEEVCYFEDRHGRRWMALHRWDTERVERRG